MRNANGQSTWMVALNATLLGLGCALTLGCGSKVMLPVGGETGFLEACGSDADCASGLCACGVCTRVCETSSECGNDAKCTAEAASPACSGESRSICVAATTSSDDVTGATSTNDGQTTAPGSEDCHGPGSYGAGKEGDYRPCCEGLTEVEQLGAVEGEDGPLCLQLPGRLYACVEGSCGDGVCEVGEDVHCGCVDDCPGAAWETTDSTSTNDTSEQNVAPDCTSFGCDGTLLQSSSGRVEIEVEVEGEFCALECGDRSAVTLTHLDSGSSVAWGKAPSCDSCPGPDVALCVFQRGEGFTWDGSVRFTDSTCVDSFGETEHCQLNSKYAPRGRYTAQLCTAPVVKDADGEFACPSFGTSELEPECVTVEFDYPTSEPVVLHLDNRGVNPDAGVQTSSHPVIETTAVETTKTDAGAPLDASVL